MNNLPFFDLLSRPALWARSAAPFWDDEHISKGMLAAHLSPDWDAASRKTATIEKSVDWLCTVLPAGARVLDLGCGPGLYASRLSSRGYRVVGMDYSRRSIDYARAHDDKTEYLHRNYLDMDYVAAFDAILLIFCDYAALTAPERAILLDNVRRALKPDGVFIFDVFTPAVKKTETKSWSMCERGGFYSEQPYVCLDATYLYDGDISADVHLVITPDAATPHIIWDTRFTLESLTAEAEARGFHVLFAYGDVCGAPLAADSETICTICGV